jgi:hypothetical protein
MQNILSLSIINAFDMENALCCGIDMPKDDINEAHTAMNY